MVTLLDDSIHEDDEEFRLVLGTPKSKSKYGAALGEQKETLVSITDKKDSEFTNTLNAKSVLTKLANNTWSFLEVFHMNDLFCKLPFVNLFFHLLHYEGNKKT